MPLAEEEMVTEAPVSSDLMEFPVGQRSQKKNKETI